jgi:hypothetical protein
VYIKFLKSLSARHTSFKTCRYSNDFLQDEEFLVSSEDYSTGYGGMEAGKVNWF